MEHNNEQNHLNGEVAEVDLDITLTLEVQDSRTHSETTQNQENSQLEFVLMEGEQNNPVPNVWSGSNGATISSSNTVSLDPMGFNRTVSDDGRYVEMTLQDYLVMLVHMLTTNLNAYLRNWNNNQAADFELDIEISVETDNPDLPENNVADLADDAMEYVADDDYLEDMEIEIDDLSYENLLEVEEQIGNVNTGLSEDTIANSLICYIYLLPQLGATTCCICREDFTEGEMIAFLDCAHDEFHYQCIKDWLVIKNECPLCKSVAVKPESSDA